MTERAPRVPRDRAALVRLLERTDLTALELERARVGGTLILADEVGRLVDVVVRLDGTASRLLESLAKLGSRHADSFARLVEGLARDPD